MASLGASTYEEAPATPLPVDATPIPELTEYGPVQGREAFRLAFLNPFPDHSFWQAIQESVMARSLSDGVLVESFALEAPSVPQQLDQIADALSQGYDAIILGAVDPRGVVPGILAANQAGIPVLAVDVKPADGAIVSLIQIDNATAAFAAGEFIAEAIGGEGVVLNLQGDMTSEVALDRDRGVRTAFEQYPGIRVDSYSADWDRDVAGNIAGDIVATTEGGTAAFPRALFAANDAMAMGAVDAFVAAGFDSIVAVGFGGEPESLEAIAAGDLAATVAQRPSRIGALAVDVLVRHLNGDSVPEWVDPGFNLVTEENVDEFVD